MMKLHFDPSLAYQTDAVNAVCDLFRGQETALSDMSPLCTLRYSATHIDKHHMVYRLDALDAYQASLVKQIEITGGTIEDAHNKPYVRVLSAVQFPGPRSWLPWLSRRDCLRTRQAGEMPGIPGQDLIAFRFPRGSGDAAVVDPSAGDPQP